MADADDIADEVDALVADTVKEFQQAELLAIGHQALNIIVLRTKQGMDVDHKTFVKYSPSYAKYRESHGRSASNVDLAFTGHMQQAITVSPGKGEVSLEFLSQQEAIKAAAHDHGVNSSVSVRSHTRRTAVDVKTGRRVSADEARKDRKRKSKRVGYRVESVESFQRNQRLPKREWFDVRHPSDTAIVERSLEEIIAKRFEK